MSKITRRSLFGLGIGAAAIPVVGIPMVKSADLIGQRFRDLHKLEARIIHLGKIENEIKFSDAIPDGTMWFGRRREVPSE